MIMKTLLTTVAALTFSAAAFAGSPFSEDDTYGTVLFDQGPGGSGSYTVPDGAIANTINSSDTFGSVLYDLNRITHEHALSAPPAIGDDADDYGNVLYDLGARY